MNKCYGYIRVSTKDQEDNGVSLKAQQDTLHQWFTREKPKNDWDGDFRVFIDGGVSAFKKNLPKRPQGNALIATAQPGDTVVFTKLDRAFRSVADGNITLEWFKKKSIRIVFLDLGNGQPVDAATIPGFLQINGMLQLAQLESMMKSERTKATHKYLYEQRGWVTQPLPGHEVYNVGRIRKQRHDPDQIENAKKFLACLWTKGVDAAGEMIKNKEVQFWKKRKGKFMPCFDVSKYQIIRQVVCRICERSLMILYYTKLLAPFARQHGIDPAALMNPAKGLVRSPVTNDWYKADTRFAKWEEHYDLSGTTP